MVLFLGCIQETCSGSPGPWNQEPQLQGLPLDGVCGSRPAAAQVGWATREAALAVDAFWQGY